MCLAPHTPFCPILPSTPALLPPHTPVRAAARPIFPTAPASLQPQPPVHPRLPSALGSLPPQPPVRPSLPSAPYSRVIRTSLRATLTVNPRRVSMGLSRLPSPVLSSTHACEWSWWRFTFRFLAFLATTVTLWIHFLRYGFKTQPNITASAISGIFYGKCFGFCCFLRSENFRVANSQAQYL